MNARIERLRQTCIKETPSVSGERAALLTAFYRSDTAKIASSMPVLRAKAFEHLLHNQTIWIGEQELIVGERGPKPKATPTYPELCCHSLDDLRILNDRPRTAYAVSDEVRSRYQAEIIPFWAERSMRNLVFNAMSPGWLDAFEAGVFTEFMEQRAPGHAVLDDKIYRQGMLDFLDRISESKSRIAASDDPARSRKLEELDAMAITCRALITFAERHATLARQLASEAQGERREELLAIADVCDHVPAYAPRTFHEALQMYWFVHLGVIIELNEWDSFNPGRLDLNLYPFYCHEMKQGTMNPEDAKELLSCLWIKISQQPAPPKVGVTDEGSATYNDFALINAGGLTPAGEDGVNELSYLMLDVVEELRLPYTGSCIQLSRKNPDRFLERALEVVRQGFGQPSIFNTDAIQQEFLRAGKSKEDALAGGPSGCVTISAFGKESCVLTGYMNWPKILEFALHNGMDPQTGKQLGPKTGCVEDLRDFDTLFEAYCSQLEYFVNLKIEGNTRIEKLFAETMPAPFLSVLVDDCIEKGEDYNGPGPRYPTTYIQGVGLGTTTDALTAIKEVAFEQRAVRLPDIVRALDTDFDGQELLRTQLRSAPKFGNDDDRADVIAQRLFDAYFDLIDGRPNSKGGHYRINLLPTTVHVFFGRMVGATADGRLAGTPLSDGISPTQGADRLGPTAVLKSVGKIDHVRTGGTLLNQRFLPDVLQSESDLRKVGQLVRTYFRFNGHHIQFNVVDSQMLLDAQQHPERAGDLIVRVAGYSDYFLSLDRQLQDEIIARTAHGEA